MKSVFFLGPSHLELREVRIPEPGPGEVVVKVEAALTCGTDLKGYVRGHRLFVPPMPFGHEFAGLISAVGAGVAGWREGDAVTAANSAPCNACFYCRRGRQQLCEDLDNRFNWGAFAEYICVPAHIVAQNMHRVPAGLPFAQAALIEPLACALHGVRDAGIQLGDTVAIIGAGAQGLMQVQLARASGAAQVIVVGRAHGRLERARRLGAHVTISTLDGDPIALVRELTGGRGADVTIESAGSAATWQLALALTRAGGTALMFSGLPGGTEVAFDATRLHYQEITAKGCFHHTPRLVEQALGLLAAGVVDGAALIDGQIGLDQLEDGLQRMARSEAIKLEVIP
ncbi:MAG TPA: zinc-binding dehydrogenase [Roseiflexaceae bacterium]|nr:zinc-binding dehydrogenase [Roseiflexaceae bacterium]